MAQRPTMYQVDAFTNQIFKGNPAAVMELKEWPNDDVLLSIASENNLSETAFLTRSEQDGYDYDLRWFTPAAEVDLCGHATLASAHVLFEHLHFPAPQVNFMTRSGALSVRQQSDGLLVMDFPAAGVEPVLAPPALLQGLNLKDSAEVEVYQSYDYIVVLPDQRAVEQLSVDFNALSAVEGRGVVVTAPGNDCDFVSRCFFPKLDVNEDPVTGSAHCELAPLWAQRLGKSQLSARQLSLRGGDIECEVVADRVMLRGRAATYMVAQLHVELAPAESSI
ncbi:MAG: PhzF family phenazine biosynthesis protein [Idiomarina sp.]|nr:PhzF family phenazine biosynthesis protein [Idiomarina sp.]